MYLLYIAFATYIFATYLSVMNNCNQDHSASSNTCNIKMYSSNTYFWMKKKSLTMFSQ